MYAAELEKCTKKIKKLINKGILDGKNIFIFGVSDNTRQIIKILRTCGYNPVGVVDNDNAKHGSYCSGIKVVPVWKVENHYSNIWLMYSFYWREMRLQLMDSGVCPKNIYPLVQKERPIWGHLIGCVQGKNIYQKLLKKYGDVTVFLCPYTGTGDVYLIGTFWKEYVEVNNITNYVFIVISGACKKVASLFDIKNVILLNDQKDAGKLISYYCLCPDKVNLKILNDAWAQINDNASEWFRGYKGWYFTDLFRKFVFDLPDQIRPQHPVLMDKEEQISKVFEEKGLLKGNTVVLSPYSNTLSDLPSVFWERLCDVLVKKGYVVCTNSSGPSEPPIKGSVGVFFPLDIAPQFVNKAGTFIGVRSGFCDVVSGCNAKKIILYDKTNRFYNCSSFEYFSLKRMDLCDDAYEIEFEHDENSINEIIEKIGGYIWQEVRFI